MRVKRYVVDSMPDALQKIRTDLGKDAVILNTKEFRSGGFMGFFSKKKIEVIAATDGVQPSGAGGGRPAAASKAPSASVAPSSAPPVQAPQAQGMPSAPARAVAAAYSNQREDKLVFPEVPDVLPKESASAAAPKPPAPRPPASSPPSAPPAGTPKEDMLLEEIKQMKEMMTKLSRQSAGMPVVDPVIEQLYARLGDQELAPGIIDRMMERLTEEAEAAGEAISEQFALQSVRRQLEELMAAGKGGKPIAADTRIAHFVGPTGVGKTTTIAKLAAEQVLKYQRKVGFITSDTYRIAAVEQLRTYATILNVPLEVVFSPLDLAKAFEQLKDRDLIFMDTAGRNFRNEMYVSELNALLQARGQSETYLVLSLTTKYKDMKAITSNFSKFKLDKVLFTKLDETDSYGAIINLIHEFGLQPSYVANGQSVPDDIEELDEQHIIELMLEDKHHE